jgi:hypothetical protein
LTVGFSLPAINGAFKYIFYKNKMNKNQNKQYFRTSSFYTAVFLCVKGLELVDIDRNNPQRCQFIFVDTLQREKLIEAFSFGKENSREVLIDARKFVMAIKMLKDKLYANKGSN